MRLVLVGPREQGKGTQAAHIAKHYAIPQISTGDIFRENVSNNTDLGQEAKKHMNAGDLVPDEITIAMVRDRLDQDDARDGFLLDGFPRTEPQAEALSDLLGELGSELDAVLELALDDEEVVRRLSGRRTCRTCGKVWHVEFDQPAEEGVCDDDGGQLFRRDDDAPETVQRRLEVYAEQTEPLVGYYESRGILRRIDASGKVDEVTGRAITALDERRPDAVAVFADRKLEIKTPAQLVAMRRAGLVVCSTLALVEQRLRAGTTTAELDALAEEHIRDSGAVPSFLGYHGFPGSLCISVNEQVVHGIPGPRVLASGDVVSVDCGAIVDGWHGDAAVTVALGDAPADVKALLTVTEEALWQGIGAVRAGGRVSDVSAAVEAHVGCKGRPALGIVEDYVGHGIGSSMHLPPSVPNRGRAGRGPRLVSGIALAVEPMLVLGDPETTVLADDWTVVTSDGSLAAHFEHTVALTDTGAWVLTARDGGRERLTAMGVPYGGID